ncbi:hypothetical protein GBA52_010057, partial [Prunus armeniaca]
MEGGATGSRKTRVSFGLKRLETRIRKAADGFVWEDQFGGCGQEVWAIADVVGVYSGV